MKKPLKNEIELFFHCKRCLQELPDKTAPRDWLRLEVGRTPHGIQVWCVRHECNIVHLRFEDD